jgi:hypothetical protein
MTTVADPFEETRGQLADAAKWVVPGVLVGEVAWIGGAAMMLAAVGSKIWNPFKIKKMMAEIAEKANDSKLFQAGFWVNTTAAVSQFGIITGGVVTELPPRSWGLAGFGIVDLAATIAVRRAIRRGIKHNTLSSSEA